MKVAGLFDALPGHRILLAEDYRGSLSAVQTSPSGCDRLLADPFQFVIC